MGSPSVELFGKGADEALHCVVEWIGGYSVKGWIDDLGILSQP